MDNSRKHRKVQNEVWLARGVEMDKKPFCKCLKRERKNPGKSLSASEWRG